MGKGLEGVIDRFKSIPLSVTFTPEERPIIAVNNYHIGYVVDAPFFDSTGLGFGDEKKARIEIATRFEEYTQKILKDSKPRIFSGLHPYSHIYRDAETAFQIAKVLDIPIDFVTLLVIIGHDSIEDRSQVKGLLRQWEEAVIKTDHNRRRNLEELLRKERAAARDEIEQKLESYLKSTGVTGKSYSVLRNDIKTAADLILDVTRFSDMYPYAISMGRQYRKIGSEKIDRVLIRAFAKNVDRTANLREYGFVLPQETMAYLERVFNDDRELKNWLNVGTYLREKFGTVRGSEVIMPPALRVGTAFNGIFPLHFFNETLNYNGEVYNAGGRTQELLRLASESKRVMIYESQKLLDSAGRLYESDKNLPKGTKQKVDRRIDAKKATNYYPKITPDGFTGRWVMYDVGGRETIEALDRSPDKKAEVYEDSRDMGVLIPMFGQFYLRDKADDRGRHILVDDPEIKYNPSIHQHFTLTGIEDLLRSVRGDQFWELVAREKLGHPHQSHLKRRIPYTFGLL